VGDSPRQRESLKLKDLLGPVMRVKKRKKKQRERVTA